MKARRLAELIAVLGDRVDVEVQITRVDWQMNVAFYELHGEERYPGSAAALSEILEQLEADAVNSSRLRQRLANQRRELRRLSRDNRRILEKFGTLVRENGLLEMTMVRWKQCPATTAARETEKARDPNV